MAAGDAKYASYPAAVALTVTNLHSIATSATWVAGWESALIDNTSNLYTDYRITALIKVAAAGIAAAEIRMYLVAMNDDSVWPDVFDGTESVETVASVEIRDAICHWAAGTRTDATVSRIYPLNCKSVAAVFDGNMPKKFVVFITHSTGANLAASGNLVTYMGSYINVAQS